MTKKILILCIIAIAILSQNQLTFAHKLLLDPISEDAIVVMYADGTISTDMTIEVYNREDILIERGKLDANGHYTFPKEAYKIVADDGMGHRLTWLVGSPGVKSGGLSTYLKFGVVILIFAGIALYFKRS